MRVFECSTTNVTVVLRSDALANHYATGDDVDLCPLPVLACLGGLLGCTAAAFMAAGIGGKDGGPDHILGIVVRVVERAVGQDADLKQSFAFPGVPPHPTISAHHTASCCCFPPSRAAISRITRSHITVPRGSE